VLGLAGIIFFFAFNWEALPDLAKLGLVEVGFVACIAGATLRQANAVTSKVLLVSSAVLIGVFLAIFGQVYQTGADPWQLFALWSALMLPLVALSRTQAGWVIFGTVLSTALILFMDQRLYIGDYRRLSDHLYPGSVALVFGALWVWLESARSRHKSDWLEPPWSRKLFAVVVFGGLALPEVFHTNGWLWHIIQLTALGAASLWVWQRHSRREYDLGVIALGGVAWLVVCVARFGIWIFENLHDEALNFLILGAFTLALSGVLVWGLRELSERAEEAR
jgi:uncharacterized membrane protein